jgi:hypothetical protein
MATVNTSSGERLTTILITFALTVGVCVLAWLFWLRPGQEKSAQDYPYEYGRPLKDGEVTYAKYQQYLLDETKVPEDQRKDAARGMDTWYWWTGGDQHFWRDISKQTGILPIKADLLALLHSTPRSRRFELLGTINDPD